jgi:hypothetical protein
VRKPYASETVEDVDIVTGVEVINGTLTVDLKGVYKVRTDEARLIT